MEILKANPVHLSDGGAKVDAIIADTTNDGHAIAIWSSKPILITRPRIDNRGTGANGVEWTLYIANRPVTFEVGDTFDPDDRVWDEVDSAVVAGDAVGGSDSDGIAVMGFALVLAVEPETAGTQSADVEISLSAAVNR